MAVTTVHLVKYSINANKYLLPLLVGRVKNAISMAQASVGSFHFTLAVSLYSVGRFLVHLAIHTSLNMICGIARITIKSMLDRIMRRKRNLTLLITKLDNVVKKKKGATLGAKDEQNMWIHLRKKRGQSR
jgi:hypothetical protein